MNTAYAAVCARMRTDLVAVLGTTQAKQIWFGPRMAPYEHYPNATVLMTGLTRTDEGARSIRGHFEQQIEVRVAKSTWLPEAAEAGKLALACQMVQKLAPYNESSVPSPSGPYAGVGSSPRVTDIDLYVRDMDEKTYWALRLTFTWTADVYQ